MNQLRFLIVTFVLVGLLVPYQGHALEKDLAISLAKARNN